MMHVYLERMLEISSMQLIMQSAELLSVVMGWLAVCAGNTNAGILPIMMILRLFARQTDELGMHSIHVSRR